MTWLLCFLRRLTYRELSSGDEIRVAMWRANARSAMQDKQWPMLRRVE